jgi:hypothetical protein
MKPLLALLLLATPAAAAPTGTWDFTPEACAIASEGRLAVTETNLTFHESTCSIAAITPVERMEGTFVYDLTCTGEGETWDRRLILAETLEGQLLTLTEGTATLRHRCAP